MSSLEDICNLKFVRRRREWRIAERENLSENEGEAKPISEQASDKPTVQSLNGLPTDADKGEETGPDLTNRTFTVESLDKPLLDNFSDQESEDVFINSGQETGQCPLYRTSTPETPRKSLSPLTVDEGGKEGPFHDSLKEQQTTCISPIYGSSDEASSKTLTVESLQAFSKVTDSEACTMGPIPVHQGVLDNFLPTVKAPMRPISEVAEGQGTDTCPVYGTAVYGSHDKLFSEIDDMESLEDISRQVPTGPTPSNETVPWSPDKLLSPFAPSLRPPNEGMWNTHCDLGPGCTSYCCGNSVNSSVENDYCATYFTGDGLMSTPSISSLPTPIIFMEMNMIAQKMHALQMEINRRRMMCPRCCMNEQCAGGGLCSGSGASLGLGGAPHEGRGRGRISRLT